MTTLPTVTSEVVEPRVLTTGTRGSRLVGIAALIGLGWLVVFGLLLSPADSVQGDAVRMLYVHVPSAWLAYLSFFVTFLGSVLYLVPRTRSLGWDRMAHASAEIGVLFTGLALLTGMIWGNLTWGVFWTWDARLTSTALLFLLFLGYLALRRLPATPDQRAKRAAILGIVAFIDVPIVHMSVEWWRTLHQKSTVLKLDPEIDGLMLFSLFVGLVAFSLVYVWLMLHRTRTLVMADELDDTELAAAIAERQSEAAAP